MSSYKIITEPFEFDSSLKHTYAINRKGDYIGNSETAKWLCDQRGIAPELISPSHSVCSIGFCDEEQKWYGWSHRAIFGFGIGSIVSKGDCAYVPDNPEELIEEHANWLDGRNAEHRRAECQILPDRTGIRILHSPLMIDVVKSAGDLEDALSGEEIETEEVDLFGGDAAISVKKCGRGKWEAKTLADARQMAIDFAESVA
ncbi:MAG: hypothetical protein AAF650_01470 [Pseudomonadota bacterium]